MRENATRARELRDAFFDANIDGVAEVRIDGDFVYFVLATHDLDRDERIGVLMSRFDDLDYQLVPLKSADMVPTEARPI